MSLNFIPDYYFADFLKADVEFLVSIGVKGIVLDVDNTLEPYEHSLPGEHVIKWVESLKSNGISLSIVSNNNSERIDRFNKDLGLFAISKAKKPFKKNVLRAIESMGTDIINTVLMGDQIFTDIWAAHNAGIRGILVPPINDRKDLLTRIKRKLEKPFMRKYFKRISKKEDKS